MRRSVTLLLTACWLTAAVVWPTPAGADDACRNLTAEFDRLVDDIGEMAVLNRGQRNSLQQKVRAAQRAWDRGQACTSSNILNAYLNAVEARRRGGTMAAAEYLFNRGWSLRQMVVGCAGPGDRCADPSVGREPVVEVMESTLDGLTAEIRFAPPELHTRQRGGETWTELTVPGTRYDSDRVGEPSVPYLSRIVAVPRGAMLRVQSRARVAPELLLNLSPVQDGTPMDGHTPDDYTEVLPPDEVFDDPPFVKHDRAYAVNRSLPEAPCRIEPVGTFRDLEVAALECAAGRYNPARDLYTPFSSVAVEVGFDGGDRGFVTTAALHPFEGNGLALADATLNGDLVREFVLPDLRERLCVGEELLILTHADLRIQADALADWKRSRGVVTSVVEVNDGAGPAPDTVGEIRAFLGNRYDSCAIRFSYVLIFGDAEHVPTSYDQNPVKAGIIASDFRYGIKPSLIDQWGIDWAVTRVPVDPDDAQVYVDKVIGYEGNPPSPFNPFYSRAAIASQFECCQIDEFYLDDTPGPAPGTDQRAFIQVVEDVRNRMLAEGFSVDRIYTETVDPNYIFDPTPLYYANGTDLPFALQPPYPWPGQTSDIAAAWNEGRFWFIHLDHGGASGWSHPRFDRDDAAALTNGPLLPFVLGYNCSSGYFDNETVPDGTHPNSTYFTERLLRNPNGGAIGSIAASRTTFAHGNIMIRGATDSAFPNIDPTWGPMYPKKRIGDILTHARLYMTHEYGWGDNTKRHYLLYHGFGDPTVEIWGSPPYELPVFVEIDLRPEFLQIWYEFENAVVTVWQDLGRAGFLPIARGTIMDGTAQLEYVNDPVDGVPLQLSANADDAITTALRATPRAATR